MKTLLKFFIAIGFGSIVISCQNRDWTNPFDPNCPKEIWTPTDFKVVQEGTTIKLTWNQTNMQISGFKIQKSVGGVFPISLNDQPQGTSQLVDNALIGGKTHSYSLTAYAGSNLSNTVTAQITPLLKAGITTSEVSSISFNGAILGGSVTTDGGAAITTRGVCYSLTRTPTLSNSYISIGAGTGNFSYTIAGLSPNSVYYARSCATNSQGTAYGNEVSFKTLAPPFQSGTITDIDGNVYNSVTIGTQVWIAENLKTTKYNDGVVIPNVIDNSTWINATSAAYCWYGNDASSFKNTYGAIYNWFSISSGKLAPIGWHVPTSTEWATLINYVGSNVVAAKIKMQFGWDTNLGTNETGFSLLPAGFRASDTGGFWHAGYAYNYWLALDNPLVSGALGGYVLADWTGGIFIPTGVSGVSDRRGNSIRCLKDAIPIISTTAISSITQSSAASGGVISSGGGQAITTRGVCWNSAPNPIVNNSKTTDGSGTGSFISSVTGLSPGTTYYLRAYATSSVGTGYGNQVIFTTPATLPTISYTITGIPTYNSSFFSSSIISDGGAVVTSRGFCWSLSHNPSITDNKTVNGSGIGSFSDSIKGLSNNLTYYIRSYATNSIGTAYGSEYSVIIYMNVPDTSIADIDGNVYKTVKIGNQIWMAENLKVTKYSDGTAIPNVTDNSAWINLSTPGFCWYNNDAATNKSVYGGLYNWYTVNTGKLCPISWHVPTDSEWTTLSTFLGGESVAGGKLKEPGTIHWASPNLGATNEAGFTALPGGYREPGSGVIGNPTSGGNFAYIGLYGHWFSSTEYNTYIVNRRYLYYNNSAIGKWDPFPKTCGFSIRCIKD